MYADFISHCEGGEHGIEEAEGWLSSGFYLEWLLVLAIYSKCEFGIMKEKIKNKIIGIFYFFINFTSHCRWSVKLWEWQISLTEFGGKLSKMWKSKVTFTVLLFMYTSIALFGSIKLYAHAFEYTDDISFVFIWTPIVYSKVYTYDIAHSVLSDLAVCAGHLIPEGWCVLTSFISVHMDEQNYHNPYHFDPWRWEVSHIYESFYTSHMTFKTRAEFDPGRAWTRFILLSRLWKDSKTCFFLICWQKIGGATVNNNNFTPFGGGQRLCPGLELSRLEISIFLHHLVTSYG